MRLILTLGYLRLLSTFLKLISYTCWGTDALKQPCSAYLRCYVCRHLQSNIVLALSDAAECTFSLPWSIFFFLLKLPFWWGQLRKPLPQKDSFMWALKLCGFFFFFKLDLSRDSNLMLLFRSLFPCPSSFLSFILRCLLFWEGQNKGIQGSRAGFVVSGWLMASG